MKLDLRAQKTERLIKEAFITLVEEKGYSNVTIKDIAQKAVINRNTFYLHYDGKDDLIQKTTLNVLKSQAKEMEELATSIIYNYSEERLTSFLHDFLLLLSKEIEFYRIILTDPDLSIYITALKDFIKENCSKFFLSNSPRNSLIIEYFINGAFGIITQWIIYDTLSIKKTAQIMGTLIYENTRHIVKKE